MSFLRGRLGATEGKYFKEESELAAARRRQQLQEQGGIPSSSSGGHGVPAAAGEEAIDVLPEILRHSVPLSARQEANVVRDPVVKRQVEDWGSLEARNAARAALQPVGHVPEVRLGRSKYSLDIPTSHRSVASTANQKRVRPGDVANVQAVMRGLGTVSKAFGVATVLVYGGGVLAFLLTCRAIGANSLEEIPVKAQAVVEPRMAAANQRWAPLRERVEQMAARWRMTEEEQRAVGRDFARAFGVSQSSPSAPGDTTAQSSAA